jgi:response regulator RpfG family c-di-GMP phosphodiesterase
MNAGVDVTCNLFYVDDDPDDLEFFKVTAASIGEDVCVFLLGDLMLHALHHPPPDPSVVFIDLNMPTKNGFEVIQEIKSAPNLENLPIVVYSTAATRPTIEKCRELGVSLYITKPTNIGDLKKIIKHVVNIDWKNYQVNDSNFVFKV